jgi:membrane protein YqaA with SNARE-associated domain
MVAWRQRMWQAASGPRAVWILGWIALVESVVFPIPPDPLLLAMGLAAPRRVFWYAAITTFASVLGGLVGYVIGFFAMDLVGWPIIQALNLKAHYNLIQEWYRAYDAWAVAVAGLTPVPYKLCTLTAGAFGIHMGVFFVASVVSRGLRFFTIALLIFRYGEAARRLIEKRLAWIVTLMVLLVLGLVITYRWIS